jgi:hypothetical protein
MENRNVQVGVSLDINDITRIVNVSVLFPRNQEKLTVKETAHVLVSGILTLIRSCDENSPIKDYELMEEVVNHLNSEFTSPTSYSDAKKIDNVFKDGK